LSTATNRIDKWLWYARFFKSRTLAAKMVADGHVRVNCERVTKTHGAIRAGDVLTFPQGRDIRVVKVVDLGSRRGPATEAVGLYEDLTPPEEKVATQAREPAVAQREPGSGRPTKAERRARDHFINHNEAL
jgi:ribosome-associated heat shock protein Hsp15